MLTIWGRRNSVNVQKVLWAADECGQAWRNVDVGGPLGGLDTPQYAALNPNRLIPTLQDGELTVWESNAIVRYLAACYAPTTLWCDDPVPRAIVDQWMDWQLGTLMAPMRNLFLAMVRLPPEQRDPVRLDKMRLRLAALWRMVEDRLTGRPYIGGDSFGLADIAVGSSCHRWFALPIERPDLPNLRAWYDRLGQRPAYREHVMVTLG